MSAMTTELRRLLNASEIAERMPVRVTCLGSEGYAIMTAPDERKRSHRLAFFGHEQWDEDRANAELTAFLLTNAWMLLSAAEAFEQRAEEDAK